MTVGGTAGDCAGRSTRAGASRTGARLARISSASRTVSAAGSASNSSASRIADVQAGEHVAAKTSKRIPESTGGQIGLEHRDVARDTSRIDAHVFVAPRADDAL